MIMICILMGVYVRVYVCVCVCAYILFFFLIVLLGYFWITWPVPEREGSLLWFFSGTAPERPPLCREDYDIMGVHLVDLMGDRHCYQTSVSKKQKKNDSLCHKFMFIFLIVSLGIHMKKILFYWFWFPNVSFSVSVLKFCGSQGPRGGWGLNVSDVLALFSLC